MTLVNAETGEIIERTLAECEEVIGRGLASFVEVGAALAEVRDGRLYREHFATFETYCEQRWNLKRAHAYRLIESADVVEALSPNGDTTRPANEAQARALAPLKQQPEQMAEAWAIAIEATGGKPTAKAVEEAVADIISAGTKKAAQKAEDKAALDEVRREFQPDDFDEAAEERRLSERGGFSRLCLDLSKMRAPGEFLADHKSALTKRHINQAERAYAWLAEFLVQLREAA